MGMRKLTLAVLFAAALAGCGGSKDKAEELIEVSGLTKHYSTIVEIASASYASRYPMLEREQIRNVVRDKLDQDELKSKMVDIYADHFDDEELELMIRANKHPEQAMAIILGSKEGRALAEKVMDVQKTISQDMQKSMVNSDDAIIDALDELKG
ncbi:hypothetical protein [Pseudomonas sp. fls2-241-R2A-110]|uniref:hypothetical protein n=1 Tax=unclassified Pseudomonas TaxID=196821 RepID=UPI00255617DE|nr:hypothetical protein [Pseudomonas sp. fls2-241-R2A-110]